MAAEDKVRELAAENAVLHARIEADRVEILGLTVLVGDLKARILDLENRTQKTSKNSSRPPSTDSNSARAEAKETRADRRRKARAQMKGGMKGKPARQGKQPGAEGRNLERVPVPDRKVTHRPQACAGCGCGLGDAEVVSRERRQVFDLPPIKIEVTEHETVKVRCGCGTLNQGVFPAEATAPACWGPGVRALGLYLTHRQHIPLER